MAIVNLDEQSNASAMVDLPGSYNVGLLAPHWTGDQDASPRSKATSRQVELNGQLLTISSHGDLPPMKAVKYPAGSPLTVPPLQLAFVVFPEAKASACLKQEKP